MTVSDGSLVNNTFINSGCHFTNSSFASRRNGLILSLTSPYQPFDIDLHLIDTVFMYTAQSGRIVSPQFPGSDGGYAHTTPNNYRGVYKIISTHYVSMYLKFTYFRVQPPPAGVTTCSKDAVIITRDHVHVAAYCGDGKLPPSVNVLAKELTLEYITDYYRTYAGFSAVYMICSQEVNLTKSSGSIDFGMFPPVDRTCIFTIRLQQRERIQLDLELEFSTPRNCSQYLTIFRDNERLQDSNCKGFYFIFAEDIRLEFTLQNNEMVVGNYSIGIHSVELFEITTTTTTAYIKSDDSALGVALTVIGVVVTLCNVVIFANRRKKCTSKTRQNDEPGTHTSRDNLNLQAVGRSEYESPIVPTSESNYSILGEEITATVPNENEYVDIGSTEHQLDSVTCSNQQEHVYESATTDSNIYDHKYQTLNS